MREDEQDINAISKQTDESEVLLDGDRLQTGTDL
jgi:hypothetical protein